jgi:hypothetical protein
MNDLAERRPGLSDFMLKESDQGMSSTIPPGLKQTRLLGQHDCWAVDSAAPEPGIAPRLFP